jgi:tetratricopeptide (TPR) repeat protein
MEAAARRAIALDPNSVNGIVIQAYLQAVPRRWALIEDALSEGLSLDASNPDVLSFYSGMLVMVGRVKEAIAVMQQLHELEPFIPLYDGNLADALWVDGQNEAAIAKFKENLGRVGSGSGPGLARIYASLGRYEEAADVLSRFPGNALVSTPGLSEVVVRLLRSAPAKAASPETLPALGGFGFIYLHIGAPERALEFYEQAPRDTLDILPLWHPSYAPVRKMERFKAVVRAAGLFDYWRERGWPPFCHPVGADDFACD